MPPVGAVALRPSAERGIEHAGPSQLLGFGDMAGCVGEAGELGVGDLVRVDAEGIHGNAMRRAFEWQAVVRAHRKFAA